VDKAKDFVANNLVWIITIIFIAGGLVARLIFLEVEISSNKKSNNNKLKAVDTRLGKYIDRFNTYKEEHTLKANAEHNEMLFLMNESENAIIRLQEADKLLDYKIEQK